MEDCAFKKITLEDKTEARIYLTFVKDFVELLLFKNETAWKSIVNDDDLNSFAEKHKLNLEEYKKRILEYINGSNPEVIFLLNNDEFVINGLLSKNLKVKYFVTKLEKVDYVKNVEQIMDKFYLENTKNVEKLQNITKEKNEIEKCKISCELKLKELIEKKQIDEDEQFGKFVMILNEKKRRIQHLSELLEAFKGGRPTVNPTVEVKSRKKKSNVKTAPAKKETISESENSENATTDDEYNSTDEKPLNNEDCQPSTSIQNLDFLNDDSPHSYILPKRIKCDTDSSQSAMMVPSTSKSKKTISSSDNDDDESQGDNRTGSPTIELSTQQLLDML